MCLGECAWCRYCSSCLDAGHGFVGKGKKNKKKQKLAPWDDIPDDSESEEDSDTAEWIMHQPSASESTGRQTAAQTDKPGRAQKSKVQKGKKLSRGSDAFASAEDYMPEIENDWAALPADVAIVEEEGASGSRQGKSSKKIRSRRRGNA